jgi:hypothetical protein
VELALRESTDLLAQTKPWVRFLSGLGFFSTTCAMAFMLLAFFAGGDPFPNTPGPMAVMLPIQITAMFAVCLLFYFVPSLLLWKYGSRISEHLRGRDPATFSAALSAQKSFWKYLGILVLILMGFYGVAILAFVLPLILGTMR